MTDSEQKDIATSRDARFIADAEHTSNPRKSMTPKRPKKQLPDWLTENFPLPSPLRRVFY